MKVGIMQGSLREFDLGEVLRVVGLGRQYSGVELRFLGGLAGTIFVKSGQVVSAQTDVAAGYDAFLSLFGGGDGEFYVFRAETPQQLPQPIGSLNRLLFDVAATRASATQPPIEAFAGATALPAESAIALTAPAVPNVAKPAAAPAPAASTATTVKASAPTATPAPATSNGKGSGAAGAGTVVSAGAKLAPVVAVASPKGGSGKSTVSLNLALSFARRGYSVILADADVNSDMLSAVNARARAKKGVLDLVCADTPIVDADLDGLLLSTVLPGLKLLPAVGATLPDPERLAHTPVERWRTLLGLLRGRAQLVLVDTSAGVFGPTRPILRAASHVLGVLQAEVLAARSFTRFSEALSSIASEERPQVLGVVLNMLQTRHDASLGVFQDALEELPREWLLDTTIPRHPAFLDATQQGLPLRQLSENAPPQVAFLFDNLAAELAERLALPTIAEQPQQFLI
jgi:cellulose biosynthesis protein BcsQ